MGLGWRGEEGTTRS
ncbi:hypothetical protein PDJAM_G00034170 [Pangasius djambal]|uniref:Uncharacterized protein n=1 Tax=Pangasius djambal TaxID=1691987 RepID=A0ACC5YRI3_9TELE|nr:hypothetical protein [Pangasius djambal]